MLDPSVKTYVKELAVAYPQISSVWLFGSRANQNARADSDWDLLVFGSRDILRLLKIDTRFHNRSVDLLVVYDGENFVEAREEGRKSGSLSEWAWKEEDQSTATYRATKPIYDENGKEQFNVKVTQCCRFSHCNPIIISTTSPIQQPQKDSRSDFSNRPLA